MNPNVCYFFAISPWSGPEKIIEECKQRSNLKFINIDAVLLENFEELKTEFSKETRIDISTLFPFLEKELDGVSDLVFETIPFIGQNLLLFIDYLKNWGFSKFKFIIVKPQSVEGMLNMFPDSRDKELVSEKMRLFDANCSKLVNLKNKEIKVKLIPSDNNVEPIEEVLKELRYF